MGSSLFAIPPCMGGKKVQYLSLYFIDWLSKSKGIKLPEAW